MRFVLLLVSLAFAACHTGPAVPFTEITGTWGGDDAGLIATDSVTHVHIGCTLGYTKGLIPIGDDGKFEAVGTYNVDAYPIDRGIIHPARFSGEISGKTMTITVVLTDNGRQIGPAKLVYGAEPKMGPCPICKSADITAARRQLELLFRKGEVPTTAAPPPAPSHRGTDIHQ
jgi:hypothetical protein